MPNRRVSASGHFWDLTPHKRHRSLLFSQNMMGEKKKKRHQADRAGKCHVNLQLRLAKLQKSRIDVNLIPVHLYSIVFDDHLSIDILDPRTGFRDVNRRYQIAFWCMGGNIDNEVGWMYSEIKRHFGQRFNSDNLIRCAIHYFTLNRNECRLNLKSAMQKFIAESLMFTQVMSSVGWNVRGYLLKSSDVNSIKQASPDFSELCRTKCLWLLNRICNTDYGCSCTIQALREHYGPGFNPNYFVDCLLHYYALHEQQFETYLPNIIRQFSRESIMFSQVVCVVGHDIEKYLDGDDDLNFRLACPEYAKMKLREHVSRKRYLFILYNEYEDHLRVKLKKRGLSDVEIHTTENSPIFRRTIRMCFALQNVPSLHMDLLVPEVFYFFRQSKFNRQAFLKRTLRFHGITEFWQFKSMVCKWYINKTRFVPVTEAVALLLIGFSQNEVAEKDVCYHCLQGFLRDRMHFNAGMGFTEVAIDYIKERNTEQYYGNSSLRDSTFDPLQYDFIGEDFYIHSFEDCFPEEFDEEFGNI